MFSKRERGNEGEGILRGPMRENEREREVRVREREDLRERGRGRLIKVGENMNESIIAGKNIETVTH